MAGKQVRAAHAESLGEPLTADESKLMSDNQEAEHTAPELPLEEAKTPEAEEHAEIPEVDAKPDIDPATGKQRKVDYGAFHAERERRKASDVKAQEAERTLATALGRFSVLEEIAKRQTASVAPVAENIPDINTDPVGHFKAQFEKTQRELADVSKWRQSQEANATAMNNVQRLTQIAVQHEGEFSKKTPDYQDAAVYVRSMRDQELQHMGYTDPGVRQQIITQDALQIAAQALQNNMNAAEVVYNIAKARGYAAKALAKAPVIPAQSADIQKITNAAKGQEEGSPLAQIGGEAPRETSVNALLKMSDADFEKATQGDNWRKLFA